MHSLPIPCISGRRCLFLFCTLALLGPVACASAPPAASGSYGQTLNRLSGVDEFGVLLIKAGLPADLLPPGDALSSSQARQLQLYFDLNPPRLTEYTPWLVANVLLGEVHKTQGAASRAALGRRIQEFDSLFVLRRDGYLTHALTGRPEQCVGPVEIRDEGLHAGEFEVDQFYQRDAHKQWKRVEPTVSPTASR